MQTELVKERERAKNEASARDSKIAGLFDELAAAQAEMQEARGKVDQVGTVITGYQRGFEDDQSMRGEA